MADTDLFDSDDLFDPEEYQMAGEALWEATPMPPGLDMDYFGPRPGFDDAGELGDSFSEDAENPAVDAAFDWGQPLIGAVRAKRFAHLVRQLQARGVRNPQALAAWIGRRKYGAQRFARMAAAGRR